VTGGRPVDLTSSLFLGYRHGSATMPAWPRLTTGVPAGLREAPAASAVAGAVATAQGAAAGLVSRSTLHALGDVLGEMPREGDLVAVDEFSYPITRWAVLRAIEKGAILREYRHHHPGNLRSAPGRRLFLVTDGWCPGCSRPAPLRWLQRLAVRSGGLVIVDDTLAAGVLGARPERARRPGDRFGDGTGTVRWCGLDHRAVLWVASLAKAFGSPLTVVTGCRADVNRLADAGSRWHSSPPSAADLAAAGTALRDPAAAERRDRLARNVFRVRRALRAAGLPPVGLPFPLVCVRLPAVVDPAGWQRAARAGGLSAVVQQPRCRRDPVPALLIRADLDDITLDRAVRATVAAATSGWRRSA
jgi:8-amino-7-oxononanoate synthase